MKYKREITFMTRDGEMVVHRISNKFNNLTVEEAREFLQKCGYPYDSRIVNTRNKRKFLFFYI